MKAIDLRKAGALAVAVALLACAAAPGSGAEVPAGTVLGGAWSAPATRALEVQGELQRERLPQRLEAAMGAAFGGIWYDRGAALLHVGFTSAASRRAAEAVAAEAGLAPEIVATPVRSTWADLLAEQERLGRRLADLFSRAEAATGLAPWRNSVEVELGSAVPPSRREAVEREGRAAPVAVAVVVAPFPHLRIERLACQPHEPSEANCDPPIVAGVTIEAASGTVCTAGPTVILENPTTPAQRTETFLLTAGHCIEKAKGVGEKWYAYAPAKPPNPPVKKEIGKAIEMLNGAADVGVIKIEAGSFWLNAGAVPVTPAIAPWKEKKPVPFSVISEAPPVAGFNSCFAGQTSGTECGEVKETNLTYTWSDGRVSKELAEVKGVVGFAGDSGAPWYSEASPGVVEGTDVGRIKSGNEVFQPLSSSFARLGTGYQLLRTVNEDRHPNRFKANPGEVDVTSTADGSGEAAQHTMAVGGTALTCSGAVFEGQQSSEAASELTVSATYGECTFLGQPTTVSMGGCAYDLHSSGEFDIVSSAGKSCAAEPISWEALGCRVEVPPQSSLEQIDFQNIESGGIGEVTMEMDVTGISYEATGFSCSGKGGGGSYVGKAILGATESGGCEVVGYSWE